MPAFLASALLLVALVMVCIEFGRRIRLRRQNEHPSSGLSVIDGAVFGLLGLLLGFSFSGAENRFEVRRQLIVQEANDIGTAWLRIDLLPEAAQLQLRNDFRAYADSRIAFYQYVDRDRARSMSEYARSSGLQKKIWAESVAAAKQAPSPAVMALVISSLNDMFDITTTRSVALQTHPPLLIYGTLVILALASSLIAGFGMGDTGKRPWLHTLVYAVALTVTVYTIIDLEFPRIGVIRVDRYDQTLINQRNSMN